MKRIIYLFMALLIITTSFYEPIIAQAYSAKDMDEELIIQIIEDADVFFKDETEPYGTIKEGSIFKAIEVEDTYQIQWNQEWMIVDKEAVEVYEHSSKEMDWSSIEDIKFLGKLITSSEIEVKSSEETIIATINNGRTVFFTEEDEENYVTVIGNQIGIIDKADLVTTEDKTENVNDIDNNTKPEQDKEQPIDENKGEEDKKQVELEEIQENDHDSSVDLTPETDNEEDEQRILNKIDEEEQTGGISNSSLATLSFTDDTKFFQALKNTAIYDNSSGSLVRMGILKQGEVYPRVSAYGANWHRIEFGNGYGYIRASDTIPHDGKGLKNINQSYNNVSITITPKKNVAVYDNTSGSLIPFAELDSGKSYPIIGDYGPNWFRVDVSGRVGYVREADVSANIPRDFNDKDKYFQTLRDTQIYDNSSGSLVRMGILKQGEVYPRVSAYGANWHRIEFGNGYGYIRASDTIPHDGKGLKNINQSYNNVSITITPKRNVAVYDNTSGSLIPFAELDSGKSYPIIGDYGPNWFRVDVSGRVGYVREADVTYNTPRDFRESDKFFEVIRNTPVYDNSTGRLISMGTIQQGEVYPRVSAYGTNWHRIDFATGYGYIRAADTIPSDGKVLRNINTSFKNSPSIFTAAKNLEVYDNTSGSLVPFAIINKDEQYPIVNEYGPNWYRVILSGRVGFVRQADVLRGPVKHYSYTNYNLTLSQMLDAQMRVAPQTDAYRNQKSYIHKNFVNVENKSSFPKRGTVTATSLNVREAPNNTSWIVGSLSNGRAVNLLGQVGDWYEVSYGPFKNAKRSDVERYVNPNNFSQGTSSYFQFLELSRSTGVDVSELNKILNNKGILHGQGSAFSNASRTHRINEIYLISHALLETGNGSSTLARGVRVTEVDGKSVSPKVVYNMFGIGARDGCALQCGSEYAYKQGWDTPEKAIVGGAQFIANSYIHSSRKQDTLYKMRWNPQSPATYQYATDIGWAVKQVNNIESLYNMIDNYTLYFDVPVYR